MPSDGKRSGKNRSEGSKKKNSVAKDARTNKGVTKTRKQQQRRQQQDGASKKSKKQQQQAKDKNAVASSSVAQTTDASKTQTNKHRKKSSQQQRKEFNRAVLTPVLSFPLAKMSKVFKIFYAAKLGELRGCPQNVDTIQMENGIKYALHDVANHCVKSLVGIAKISSSLKDKPTVESGDIVAADYLLRKYSNAPSLF